MMKLAISALIVASAAAFAPISQQRASTTLAVNELDLGSTEPLGVYDPLGWMTTEPESFERRRAVERKHGRIAMVAVVGNILHNADVEFPGYLSKELGIRFSDIPNGMAGLGAIPTAGLTQIVFACGFVELAIWPANNYSGDYGVGYGRPFVPNFLEGEELKRKLDMEINQGRAAMLGIFGAMVGEVVTGQTMAEQYASNNLGLFSAFNN